MENRKDVTVPMPKELKDEIEDRLGYNDSKAEWIREAIRQRLEREEAIVD
jgi:Arc/MetJ-type ribon-helix-helix transcriptional regulator